MAGRIPITFTNFLGEEQFGTSVGEEVDRCRDDEVESTGNESMKVNMNATASDVVSLDDNISVSQIDPGNFSESDIDEDSGSNCCLSFTDVLGGFPESDLDESEDEMSECMSDAGISFNSDVGSPMHSSCRSYPVSEDRDDREDSTPLPVMHHQADGMAETKSFQASSRSGDYESEVSGPLVGRSKDDAGFSNYPSRRLRSFQISKRKLVKNPNLPSSLHQNKRSPKMTKKSEKSLKRTSFVGGKRKALAVMTTMRLGDDMLLPPLSVSQAPKPARSLSIPILDLCITEDEGYLGMAEETSDDSEKEKDENKLPTNPTDF